MVGHGPRYLCVRRHMNYVFSTNIVNAIKTRIGSAESTFNSRYWLCTPGPIYCANTDNCGGGPIVAPNNVSLDENGYEIIFRQPTSDFELAQVLEAADADPFDGYRFNGNSSWTTKLVDEWANKRKPITDFIITQISLAKLSNDKNKYYDIAMYSRWLLYIESELDYYLDQYKAGLYA